MSNITNDQGAVRKDERMDKKRQEYEQRIAVYRQNEVKYKKVVESIRGLYDTMNSFDDNADGWLKELEVMGMILEKVGELHYISIQSWKYADALKKESYALAVISDKPKGRTVDQHREHAVLESQEWRFLMAEWEGYSKRWENAKLTIEEQIKNLKWKIKWELSLLQNAGVAKT